MEDEDALRRPRTGKSQEEEEGRYRLNCIIKQLKNWHHRSGVAFRAFFYIAEYLLISPRDELVTYRFSQDHVELLFNAIRRAGGWNNNPSCTQFAYIYRRILARAEVAPSNTGNVTVQDGSELEECDTTLPPVLETDSLIDAGSLFGSLYLKNATVYIAGWVVQKLKCGKSQVP